MKRRTLFQSVLGLLGVSAVGAKVPSPKWPSILKQVRIVGFDPAYAYKGDIMWVNLYTIEEDGKVSFSVIPSPK